MRRFSAVAAILGGLPATYLVDPQGRIRYQALGGRPWEQPEYIDFLRSLSR